MNKHFSVVQSAIKGLTMGGLEVVSITDNTPVPHNGCRPRKARRMWPPRSGTKPIRNVLIKCFVVSSLALRWFYTWRVEWIADGVNNEHQAGVSASCRDGWHINKSPLLPQALWCLIGSRWYCVWGEENKDSLLYLLLCTQPVAMTTKPSFTPAGWCIITALTSLQTNENSPVR